MVLDFLYEHQSKKLEWVLFNFLMKQRERIVAEMQRYATMKDPRLR